MLHVGLAGWLAVQARVEVNICEILALLGRESFCGRAQFRHPIQLSACASPQAAAGMNIRYPVELNQTERAELTPLVSGGKNAARKLKRAQILLAADAGSATTISWLARESAARPL